MAARAKTLFLLLAALCLPAYAHVPHASLVVQKPHQGVERFAQPSHRGPGAANALTAPGLARCLCDKGGRSRSTAKERDDESGLDYFGARYMSAALGRFTSADAPFADQSPVDPQSWNLYGYVRNQPLRLVDADGRKVRVSDKVALEHIRSTIPAAVRESVVVTGSGTIDSDRLNGVTSDNENVRALKFMANHSSLVEVRTDSGVEMGEFGVVEFEYTPYTLQDGTPAPTIFGGTTSEMTDTNGRIVVTLSDGTGKAAGMPGEEAAATAAHEIYGHAKRQMSGQPWLHDNGGPVDTEIKEIEDRTREMHENER